MLCFFSVMLVLCISPSYARVKKSSYGILIFNEVKRPFQTLDMTQIKNFFEFHSNFGRFKLF